MLFSSHFFLFCFESLGQQGYENTKILCNLCIHFARQDRKKWKENHATTVTKIPKTKRRKYGMNETKIIIPILKSILKWNLVCCCTSQFTIADFKCD